MGDIVSKYVLVPLLEGILLLYNIVPFSNYFTYRNMITGLIKLVVHRALLNRRNLYKGNSRALLCSWYLSSLHGVHTLHHDAFLNRTRVLYTNTNYIFL